MIWIFTTPAKKYIRILFPFGAGISLSYKLLNINIKMKRARNGFQREIIQDDKTEYNLDGNLSFQR